MASQARNSPAPCPVCGTTRFTKDARGFPVCQFGHQVQGFRIEESEEFDASTHQPGRMRLQRQKTGRARAKRTVRYRDVVSSSEWLFLHFEAFQILLRKQVEVLLGDMGLPQELELIVRDMWLLHVNLFKVKMVESTPAKLEDDDVGEAASLVRDTLRESDRGRNNSGSESSSDSENHDSDAPSGRRAKNLPTKKNTRLDGTRMEWSIAILYLACKWLRLPVMMADFHIRICNGTLPYLNAEGCLPRELAERLYANRYKSFHVANPPSIRELYDAANALEEKLASTYKYASDVSHEPLLAARICLHLGLPPEIYALARFVRDLPGKSSRFSSADMRKQLSAPCIDAAAGIVIAIKLLYGLDGSPRVDHPGLRLEPPLPPLEALLDHLVNFCKTNEFAVLPISFGGTELKEMARLHPEQFLNVASISLNARFQSKDVAEFDSIRGRNNARDAVDAEDGMPQRTASSSAEATADRTGCVRGSQYAIYSNSDKAGDVYGDYGLVIAAFSRIIRSAEVDLHAAVVDRERNLVIIGKMFD